MTDKSMIEEAFELLLTEPDMKEWFDSCPSHVQEAIRKRPWQICFICLRELWPS